ncbi:MAG TPA: hypothetical protein VG370_07325 [Chloroflexota bacterium]|jgi:hypothetical protein|nr:hypothetical protein [Chloroflexota bacterium]
MRRARPARRVLLEAVPRRDAAQRLSLAFCLLAREGCGRAHLAAPGSGRANLPGLAPDPWAPITSEEARP